MNTVKWTLVTENGAVVPTPHGMSFPFAPQRGEQIRVYGTQAVDRCQQMLGTRLFQVRQVVHLLGNNEVEVVVEPVR